MNFRPSLPSSTPRATPDEACLEAFQRQLDYVYRTLKRFGAAPSEADDLAQEVFLALHTCWTEYDSARPLRPYLFGIAFRLTLAHQRKRRRLVSSGLIEVGDPRPGPDETLQTKQTRALVLGALEHVPPPRRAVLIMHHLDDLPVDEVASVLGLPKFTVYSRLRKGRRELEVAVRRLAMQAPTRSRRAWVRLENEE